MSFDYIPDASPADIDQTTAEWVHRELTRISDNLMFATFISPIYNIPTSINKTAGGTEVGDVTDIQTLNDGNIYNLPEASGTPGFRVEINFTNIIDTVKGIVARLYYSPASGHTSVELQVHNYVTSTDDSVIALPPSAVYNYRTILLSDGSKYVDSNGNAQVVIDHVTSGNPAHDLFVDYVALLT